jgi:hypothetical protein
MHTDIQAKSPMYRTQKNDKQEAEEISIVFWMDYFLYS